MSYTTFDIQFDATFGDGIPVTDKDDPLDQIKDILEQAGEFNLWTVTEDSTFDYKFDITFGGSEPIEPTILKWWDRSQSERGPGQGQPPEIYLYRETTQNHERFSADAEHVTESGSVTLFVYSFSEAITRQYLNDAKRLLEEYMSDNYRGTNLHTIEPEESNDYRPEHLTQTTDHYVESYTVGYRDYRSSGL